MTPPEIMNIKNIVIAVLAALIAVFAYVHTFVVPSIARLLSDFYDLRQGHALSQQSIKNIEARQNGQSAKLTSLMLAASPATPAPPTVPPPPPEPVGTRTQQMSSFDLLAGLSSNLPAALPEPVKQLPPNLLLPADDPALSKKLAGTQE